MTFNDNTDAESYVENDAVATLTADVVVFSEIDGRCHVLLIKRGWAPFEGCWALPGGKVDRGETFEQAAVRELAEETGIRMIADEIRRVDVYDAPDRDPRGRYVSAAYMAEVHPGVAATAVAGDDATDAKWVPVAELLNRPEALAFDHARILADAVAVLDPELLTVPEVNVVNDGVIGIQGGTVSGCNVVIDWDQR